MDEFMLQLSYEHETVPVSDTVKTSVNVIALTQEHIQGYCMKCHAKVDIKNPRHIIMKNLRHAVRGICPRCGTKMSRFIRIEEHIQGYCIKCRTKVEIKNPHRIIMKNLRHAVQGICPRCGTKMSRFESG
jgi:Zn finger protein HypA/HybF involved in hydrogenase expression